VERKVADILADVRRWARTRSDIRGVALVGSYASGTQHPNSDVDVVIATVSPETYQNAEWTAMAVGRRAIAATRSQTFGDAWSLFVTLAEGPEIEFTFVGPTWAGTRPPREEVSRIVQQGFLILHDPRGDLGSLAIACRQGAETR
jgi:hypothetical protein